MNQYTTTEIARLSGLGYRATDYWTRRGYIAPSISEGGGSGHLRYWSDRDRLALTAIASILRSLQRLQLQLAGGKLIADLWRTLHVHDDATIEAGPIRIHVTLPEELL